MLQSYIMVFFISMVPLIELRGAIPYSQVMGLPLLESYIIAIIGNMLPVPIIYLFARKVLEWGADKPVIGGFFTWCLEKGKHGGEKLQAKAGKGLFIALLLFVGIPLRYAGSQPSRHRLQIQYPRSHGRRTSCRSHYGTGQCGRFGSA